MAGLPQLTSPRSVLYYTNTNATEQEMFITYEIINGIKWRLNSFDTAAGAKRSVTALKKRLANLRAQGRRTNMQDYGWMSAEDWANRPRPMKQVRNLMTGEIMEIPADTPASCDPSTELYYSM